MPDASSVSWPSQHRVQRYEHAGIARFITFSCHRQLPLRGHPAIRDLFVQTLAAARERTPFALYAWVVMPEHVHLLVRPEADQSFARVLLTIKLSVAKQVVARWQGIGAAHVLEKIRQRDGSHRFWLKGGGFDRNVRGVDEFVETVQYIHLNPVHRGLVEAAEGWEWSSARWWCGRRDGANDLPCDVLRG